METELANNMEKLEKLIGTKFQEYDDKLQKAKAGPASSQPDISSLCSDYSEFKLFVREALSTLKSQIELLALGLDRLETANRRKVLLIHGIPESQNEQLQVVVGKVISDQLKLPEFKLDHIEVSHRLGAAQGKIRPVLVRFHKIVHRNQVWESKTALKGTGMTMSEFLTKTRHNVFMAARAHFGIKQCWSVEGKITLLLPDKSRRKIESMGELQLLFSQFPVGLKIAEDAKSALPASKAEVTKKNRRRN